MPRRLSFTLIALALLSACADTAHEIVPTGHDGSYVVTARGSASFSSLAPLRDQAYSDAKTYCARKNLQLKPLGDRENTGGYEKSPVFSLEFQCVPPK
jgi:hypothetical protein